ncbi:ankyrin repeat domain-containing protein [Bacteroidetes bacterium endosymbiont of Geopemphigus sp.]|uniref:ankyrin repeat domain-containing protein n=1 Tax=Bacteroidetes bacterium endosymbiont of Geopemphigus sp. TaxID=2047937 RepID=UPI003D2F534F
MKEIKFFIENKADVNTKNDKEETPFHVAINYNNLEVIKLFMRSIRVNLNARNDKGLQFIYLSKKKMYQLVGQKASN